MKKRVNAKRVSAQAALEHFKNSFPEALDHHRTRFSTDIVEWAQTSFYVQADEPIELLPHQQAILRLFMAPTPSGGRWQNLVLSTVKKSGKTALAALLARYFAETSPAYSEIYLAANDLDQAVNRVFYAAKKSIQLDPDATRRWAATERELRYGNGTFIRALASDYKGEAGSNPRLTVWTELWGVEHEKDRRLFEELTPVPTQESFRIVGTSAGYKGQSDLLHDLFEIGTSGRQLTAGELSEVTHVPLGCFVEAPNPDSPVPIWINEAASMVTYWDEGLVARRMPWLMGSKGDEYYRAQEQLLRPSQYRRLHLNEWSQSEEAFIDINWWDACEGDVPELDDRTYVVIGVDGAVTSDYFAIVGVTRHPQRRDDSVAVRFWCVWTPPVGGKIDFDDIFECLLGFIKRYNVAEVAYDPYQLEDFMQRLKRKVSVRTYDFNQGAERYLADKGLYDLIRDRRIVHCGPKEIREHLLNATAKISDDSKMRITKRVDRLKVDLAVALAMAAKECLRLSI